MTSAIANAIRGRSCFRASGNRANNNLLDARVAVAGCGALGSFQAGALARAGIGLLRIIDRDYVELSNLQRQWLFDECDVEQGLPKAVAAARKIAGINSGCSRGAGGGRSHFF